jgi:hypothetical protein
VSLEHLLDVLKDQKVIPMIRGKSMEFEAFDLLRSRLDPSQWRVEKLSENPQTNTEDQDIRVTHRSTGTLLIVESKHSDRGSFTMGTFRLRVPHFKVKCHRSRSHLTRPRNDAYADTHFDILITNPSNAIIKGGGGSDYGYIDHAESVEYLRDYYSCATMAEVWAKSLVDWRIAATKEISVDGFIPRQPYVSMCDDPNWRPVENLEDVLLRAAQEKRSRT